MADIRSRIPRSRFLLLGGALLVVATAYVAREAASSLSLPSRLIVENESSQALEDIEVHAPGGPIRIGRLEDGESRTIDIPPRFESATGLSARSSAGYRFKRDFAGREAGYFLDLARSRGCDFRLAVDFDQNVRLGVSRTVTPARIVHELHLESSLTWVLSVIAGVLVLAASRWIHRRRLVGRSVPSKERLRPSVGSAGV